MIHVYNEETGYWDCPDCETDCRSDNPCDCCDDANRALDLVEADPAAEMGA